MLNILTAHRVEAMPFIERYAMTSVTIDNHQAFFKGKGVRLLVTGQGNQSGRSLSRFCDGLSNLQHERWLNFGLAGSSQFPLGQLVQGGVIGGPRTTQVELWQWPHEVTETLLPLATIRTVKEPEQRYELDGAYDMEAVMLYDELRQHENQCTFAILKLISDGPGQPAGSLNKQKMIGLIEKKASSITRLSDILLRNIDTCNDYAFDLVGC